jgi:hypothetical protein
MKFKIDTNIPTYNDKIDYSKSILMAGSCFSNEIASRFQNAGFKVFANLEGIIYHPIPIAHSILEWCSNDNENENILKNTTHFFITLGTSFGYRDKKTERIVANCQKRPASDFSKELSSIDEMFNLWETTIKSIYKLNRKIKLIFTVSPVRHIKDGVIENNRSKARLFELINLLELKYKVNYFPSYELINDELRDYRFFKEDLVHPNNMAVDFVWEQIKTAFFDSTTIKLVNEVEQLRKLENHVILTENELEKAKFIQKRESKITEFNRKHPEILI